MCKSIPDAARGSGYKRKTCFGVMSHGRMFAQIDLLIKLTPMSAIGCGFKGSFRTA